MEQTVLRCKGYFNTITNVCTVTVPVLFTYKNKRLFTAKA